MCVGESGELCVRCGRVGVGGRGRVRDMIRQP